MMKPPSGNAIITDESDSVNSYRTAHPDWAREDERISRTRQQLDAFIAKEFGDISGQRQEDRGPRTTTAQKLVNLASESCVFFRDERGEGYAAVEAGNARLTLRLRGRDFRRWLCGTFFKKTGSAAGGEAVSAALAVLEAKAAFDGPAIELQNRFASKDGAIFVDFADQSWRAIKISSDGWDVICRPPILFRRHAHQLPLPEPTRGGKLSDIHKFLAIRHHEDQLLVEAFIVAAFFSEVPRPVLVFHGPQGAAKTTAARCIKELLDPSATVSVDIGKDPAHLAQVLDHNAVPIFDNLTRLPTWAADMFCRAVTGGAFSKRQLYSDDDDIIFCFRRAILMTGINVPTHAPDLLDRMMLVELERIAPEKRRDERTFWSNFEAAKPALFGAVLDAVVGVLRNLREVKLDRMPRLADFARIACAYGEFAGVGANRMLDIIMNHTRRQTEEVLDSDPVASAIRALMAGREAWTGTAGDLLAALNERAPLPRPDGWPRSANALARRLNVLLATLSEVGMTVRRHREDRGRSKLITISSSLGTSSATSSTEKHSKINELYDVDDVDDVFPTSKGMTEGWL